MNKYKAQNNVLMIICHFVFNENEVSEIYRILLDTKRIMDRRE